MTAPFLMWDSIFAAAGATVTASSEAAGYPASNVADWIWAGPHRWRAAGLTSPAWLAVDLGASCQRAADSIVLAGHNLVSCGASSVLVRRSADGVNWNTETTIDVAGWKDEIPITAQFSLVGPSRYWRLEISGTFTKSPEIGIATLGQRLEIPNLSPDLDPYSFEPQSSANRNRAGQFIGVEVTWKKKEFNLPFPDPGYLDTEFWKRSGGPNWDDGLIPHCAAGLPFWFAWNLNREKFHVWLCRQNAMPSFRFVNLTSRRSGSFPVEAYLP